MSSKILILSHPKLTQVVQQVIDGMEQLPEVTIRDVGFGGVINFLNHHLDSIRPNIIITGGAHWGMLNHSDYSTNIPIIPIPVTRFDLLQAALQARQYGKRMAVVHYGEELKECQDVLQGFDCQCQFFSYNSKEEAASLITSLKETGIDVIIGAGLVCVLTDKLNLPSVFLHSKDSIIKILEHVARLETARLEIAATAQRWSMEFMKHPLFTYEVESHTEKPKSSFLLPNLQPKRNRSDTKDERMVILEQFLFNKRISSFFPRKKLITDVNPFLDDDYPYVSIGAFVCKDGTKHLLPLWEKIEREKEGRVFYSFKGEECRLVLLTKTEMTSEYLNKKLTSIVNNTSEQIYGGISSPALNEDVFPSNDSLAKKIHEAQIAQELSRMGSISGPICVLERSNPFSLLVKIIQHSGLPETKLLTPLFGHRNTDKLLYTLRLLLDHGLSITTVANHLGTSRQTVYALMERIESLTGLLTTPDKRFTLSLELRILDMRKAIENIAEKQDRLSIERMDPAYRIV